MKAIINFIKKIKEKVKNAPAYVVCYYVIGGKIHSEVYNTTHSMVDKTMTRALDESLERRESSWAHAAEYRNINFAYFRARHPARGVLAKVMQ